MSEPKLYLETLCEHGRMQSHGTIKGARGEELSAPGHICEGGERYEVTVAHMLSAVRAGVESGTIKGKVHTYCEEHEALVGAIPHLCNVANWVIDGGGAPTDCRINDALLISDGGESCDGSGTCEATDHIEGCYRSTYVRPVSDGGEDRP